MHLSSLASRPMLRLARIECSSVRRVHLGGTRVLLTGASGGLGQVIARSLHDRGALVLLSGRRGGALQELRAELGANAEVLEADLTDWAGVAALAEQAGS